MTTVYYVTWGEQWSPVLRGQAAHVADLLNDLQPDIDVRFLAGLSMRKFRANRCKIKTDLPSALVLPFYPGNKNWKKNILWLAFFLRFNRPRALICRGPLSAALMLRARKASKTTCMICYDGRGARSSEVEEYSPFDPLVCEMPEIERQAILDADWRIAVSNRLVQHWSERFGYSGNAHTVIPCSLARHFEEDLSYNDPCLRAELGWGQDDVIIVHLGGGAGWQHGNETFEILRAWLKTHEHLKLLVLSKPTSEYDKLQKEFSGKVVVMQVPHDKVPEVLSACDYGLLVREPTVTNQVASPVKFAEYLACGLKVLISPNLGDFSQLVVDQDIGHIVTLKTAANFELDQRNAEERNRLRKLGLDQFSKSSPKIRDRYSLVLDFLLK